MIKKINWLIWLLLVILWNYGFPEASPFMDVLVAVFLSILFIIIQLLQSRYLQKSSARSKFRELMKERLIWEFTTIINLHGEIRL